MKVLSDSKAISGELRTRLNAKLQKLDKQEDQYLDPIGDPDWPQEKLSARLRDVRDVPDERARITRQLDGSKQTGLEAGSSVLLQLVELAGTRRAADNPNSDTVPKNDAAAVTRDLPSPTSRDAGLSKASMVELRGR